MQQIPLDLIVSDPFSLDDLIVTEANRALFDILRKPHWLNPHLLLLGREGSGKSHMGRAFAYVHKASFHHALEITADFILDNTRDLVIDCADQASEEGLFHTINQSLANGNRLLLLTCKHPLEWQTTLPDLASRLKAMQVIDMPEPDDELLKSLLLTLFSKRAISPPHDAIEYLVRRMERSVNEAQKIVTQLVHYANGRGFNRALIRDFMDKSENLSWLNDND